MTATSASMSFILDEIVSGVFVNQFAQLPSLMGLIYGMRTTGRRRERTASISGLGKLQPKNPTQISAQDTPIQQFEKTFTPEPFALHTAVERELVEDEDWGWFQDLANQYSMSANRTMESEAAALWNDAFAGATFLSEDGKSLCNSAHTNVDGGNSQSNTGTSAMTADTVKSTYTSMRKFTDYKGEKINMNPDTLLVPVDLEPTAWEIVRSSQRPATANNDANFLQNRFQILSWNYLSDANNWFVLDIMMCRMHCLWYQRTGIEIFGDGDLFKGTSRIGIYSRWVNGSKDWRCCFGQNAA